MTTFKTTKLLAVTLGASLALTACSKSEQKTETTEPAKTETTAAAGGIELLNVSYDVSRDFYKDYNEIFKKHYLAQHPDAKIEIKQSHGGSSKQALSVKNGLQADVVTMNQGSDIELLADAKLVDANCVKNSRITPFHLPAPSYFWCVKATQKASKTGVI